MNCSCCGKQRAEIHAARSKLVPGVPLFMCNECIRGKHEPRFVIILAGRDTGPESVADYIVKRQFCGADILFTEVHNAKA